jgi:glycosyl transferase family 1
MPGKYRVPVENSWPRSNGKFRLVYVGAVENFYGRMLCSLIEKIETTNDLEILVVGPNDWPAESLERAKAKGIYLGFKPAEEAAKVVAGADALLVVMSFEKEHELCMRTSFRTKFLDYVGFGKPVILWGPEYCTTVRVARKHGGAAVVSSSDANAVVSLCRQIAADSAIREKLSNEALQLHQTLFNPDRLQGIFVQKITELVDGRH